MGGAGKATGKGLKIQCLTVEKDDNLVDKIC